MTGTSVVGGSATVVPVDVWWARPADFGDEAMLALLSAEELTRYHSYRFAPPRERFLAGRALLRMVLGRRLRISPAAVSLRSTCDSCGGPHGRPRLVPPTAPPDARPGVPDATPTAGGSRVDAAGLPEFSVSHSADRVVVAVGVGAPVGVDVQHVDPRLDVAALCTVALAPAESEAVLRTDPALQRRAFTTIWTRKEAVLKAIGTGLATPMHRLQVTPPHQPPAVVSWPPEPAAPQSQSRPRTPAGTPPQVPGQHPAETLAQASARFPAEVTLRQLDAGDGYQACLAVLAGAVSVTEHDARRLLAG